jgi:hypothetical protein
MAIDVNTWLNKLPGIDSKTLVDWVHHISTSGYTTKEMEQYIMDKYFIHITKDKNKRLLAVKQFRTKWKIDPDTGKEVPQLESDPEDEIRHYKEDEPNPTKKGTPEIVEQKKPIENNEDDLDNNEEEDNSDDDSDDNEDLDDLDDNYDDNYDDDSDDEEEDNSDDNYDDDDDNNNLADDLKTDILPVPDGEEPDNDFDDIPFENPDLGDLSVVDDDDDDDDESSDEQKMMEEIRKNLNRKPIFKRPQKPEEQMITQTLGKEEYEQQIKIWKPIIDNLKDTPDFLIRFAQTIDPKNPPPYVLLRPYLINNSIKDIDSTEIMVTDEVSVNSDLLAPRYVPLSEGIEITRKIWEKKCFTASLDNFTTVSNALEKDREKLSNLIFMLEVYAEQNAKGQPAFQMTLPKQALIETVTNSIEGLKYIIQDQLIKYIYDMRKELKTEMTDVSSVVEKNMTKFDKQIADAIDRVIWKVKTDVEETNMEDIKRGLLYIENKRSSVKHLGCGAYTMIGLMLDDLTRRLIVENFKIDKIKDMRRYNISELQKRLAYKHPNVVYTAIKLLHKHKQVIVYKDSSFSLAK